MSLKSHKNSYRRNEPGGHEEEQGLEDWLITYADMVTLLMCFFIIIISSSTGVDAAVWEEMRKGMTPEQQKDRQKTPLADIKESLDSLLKSEKSAGMVNIDLGYRGILMEFASNAFYQSGSADLGPDAMKIVDKVIVAMKDIDYYKFQVDVEGHTDDSPIHSLRFPSNWELSVSRATNIIKYTVEKGIDPDRLKAAGYADTKPLVPNRDASGKPIPENQAKNRRIVIRIY